MDLQAAIAEKMALAREHRELDDEYAGAARHDGGETDQVEANDEIARLREEASLAHLSLAETPAGNLSKLVGKKRKRSDIDANPSSNEIEVQRPKTFGPAKKGPRSKLTAVYRDYKIVNTRSDNNAPSDELVNASAMSVDNRRNPSTWYLNLNDNQKLSRGDLQSLKYVKDIIKNCINANNAGGNTDRYLTELRKYIHEMDCSSKFDFLKDSESLVKKSKVLEPEGISQIFDGPYTHIFPWDIVTDSEALWFRWMSGDVDTHLLRGIDTGKGTLASGRKRINYKLDKTYLQKKSPNVVGENGLSNGQWWPTRLCALRDGAHGEQEAGIHGQTGKGAYSVVVASGGYADKDYGEIIEYCGTASETAKPTKSTTLVEEAFAMNQHLRVLRAVNKKSQYAPVEGIRYDGLYEITNKEVLDPNTAMYRFTLKRVQGQNPIRYQGVEVRPTEQELAERMKIRKLLDS